MARTFDNNTANYLTHSAAVVTAPPFTISCLAKVTDFAGYPAPVGLINSGDVNIRNLLLFNPDGTGFLQAKSGPTGGEEGNAITVNSVSTGTECHLCGIETSTSSRAVVLNGDWANRGTNTTSITTTLNATRIGQALAIVPMYGDLSEVAVWDVALTQYEVEALADRMSPLLIRPSSLVAYWPLIGRYSPELDLVGGYEMTVTGTVATANHSRIFYPKRRQVLVPSDAAPVSVTPSTLALTTTTFAPTVSTPVVVTPSTRALVITTFAPTAAVRTAADYYISAAGNDSNTGLSGSPWQTSAKANSYKFIAGDRLYLNRGDSFNPLLIQLLPGGPTPTSGSPLSIGAYGSGAKPIINATTTDYGIQVLNLPYTTVEDITVFGATVTFTAGTPNTVSWTNSGCGIQFSNTTAGWLLGCVIRRNEIYGVNAGILLGSATVQSYGYDGFEIYDNVIHDGTVVGIVTYNAGNYTIGIHKNGTIRDNYIYNIFGDWNGTTGGNTGYGIEVLAASVITVERNTIKNCGAGSATSGGGPVGIMGVGAHDCIFRGNVVLNQSSQSVDGAGIHLDGNNCDDNIIDRNYIAGCKEGIALLDIGGVTSDTVVRYNIIQNSTLTGFKIDGATGTIFHNNVIYQLAGDTFECDTAFQAYNNIFIQDGGDLGSVAASTTLNRNYYDPDFSTLVYNGVTRSTLSALQTNNSQEANGLEGDSLLTNAGGGPTTWTDPTIYASTLTHYDPLSGSPVLGTGHDLLSLYTINPGPADFHYLAAASWGALFNIGADEGGTGTTVTPSTAALTLATFSPTVSTPQLCTPSTLALTITTFAPTVSTPQTLTPSTASLTVTGFAPSVTVGSASTLTPGTLDLAIATFAPTVSTPVVVVPQTLALTVTGYAPTVSAGGMVAKYPGAGTFAYSGFTGSLTRKQ